MCGPLDNFITRECRRAIRSFFFFFFLGFLLSLAFGSIDIYFFSGYKLNCLQVFVSKLSSIRNVGQFRGVNSGC